MKRLLMSIAAVAMVLGSGIAHAGHTGVQPSQYCDGTTPGQDAQHPPVKDTINTSQPAVCFNVSGGFKGAAWYDFKSNSIEIDCDKNNSYTNRCFGGYAGARIGDGSSPALLFSSSGNYDPNATSTAGNPAGSANNSFNPQSDSGEVTGCFIG